MRVPTAIAGAAMMLLTVSGCSYLGLGSSSPPPASSGSSTAPINASQARQILQDEGYSNVSNLHETSNGWQASATRNGQSTTVNVDNYGIVHTP
jgi:hypothetical protein